MDNKISVSINGASVYAEKGTPLSEIIKGEKPCGGHGRCGKCKVYARGELSELSDSEKKYLTEDEIKRGIRLSCCTLALGKCEVSELTRTEGAEILTASDVSNLSIDTDYSGYGAAIDIGTTTLASKLYDKEGRVLSEYGELNPQSRFGADVISRIEASMKGEKEALALSVRDAIDRILLSLSEKAGIGCKEIESIVITGNTAMLYLLTMTDTEPLSHAPFNAERLFGEEMAASELGLSSVRGGARVYIPRCMSAFVGADTTCALLASGMCDNEKTSLIADIGTNGEIGLWHKGELSVCSSAAGPAFEGALISMGMRGEAGAIDKVRYKDGEFVCHVIGEKAAKGICGSGLVDAVAALLESEMLDESGYLEDDEAMILDPVKITQKDVRMVQLAKSAICAGIITLLKNEKTEKDDISDVFIAGGFGSYLDIENAGYIGLIPKELTKKVKVIGNAALTGASMILLDKKMREKADAIAKRAITVSLADSPVFSDEYMQGMMF